MTLITFFDDHLNYFSVNTKELEIKKNISLAKLFAHTTDVSHHPDGSCFSPRKEKYEEHLTNYAGNTLVPKT